jgi:DNA mismatch endonuclease (patch repair protein)
MDIVSPAQRSRMMSAIRGKNTYPELVVRSVAHELGLRFRLHSSKLPGRPDLVFPKWKTVVFVHGCFWHRHDCRLAATPKTRVEFWRTKFAANQDRDRNVRSELETSGWCVLVIWECETRNRALVRRRLQSYFGL